MRKYLFLFWVLALSGCTQPQGQSAQAMVELTASLSPTPLPAPSLHPVTAEIPSSPSESAAVIGAITGAITAETKPAPTPPPAPSEEPAPTLVPTAALLNCQMPLRFTSYEPDDDKESWQCDQNSFPVHIEGTYQLPQGALDAIAVVQDGFVSDGCEKVRVNEVTVVEEPCPAATERNNCPRQHNMRLNSQEIQVTNTIRVVADYYDFYGIRNDPHEDFFMNVIVKYRAPECDSVLKQVYMARMR